MFFAYLYPMARPGHPFTGKGHWNGIVFIDSATDLDNLRTRWKANGTISIGPPDTGHYRHINLNKRKQ